MNLSTSIQLKRTPTIFKKSTKKPPSEDEAQKKSSTTVPVSSQLVNVFLSLLFVPVIEDKGNIRIPDRDQIGFEFQPSSRQKGIQCPLGLSNSSSAIRSSFFILKI